MLELRTFGGLSIQDGGAPITGAATQRKTLALLALLAAAGKHGVSRDKLIVYLWPESDTEHGRNLLNQACYALRRDLHERDVLLGASELRLNPDVVASDLQAFETALQSGDPEAAVLVYAGPFLDGFFVSGAPEFERWVDGERARLQQCACQAIEALATAAAARGDHTASVAWWRRLTALDPLSSRVALGLMNALVAAGEPAAAIQHARAHEAFLQEEVGAAPHAAVLALAKQLCDDAEHGSSSAAERAHPRRRQFTRDFVVAALPGALRRELHRATTLSAAAVLAVLLVGAGLLGFGVWGRHATTDGADPVAVPGRKMLVVLPFENRGAATDEYFADGLTEAIATRLGSVRRLGVIAWQSASQYKGTKKSPQEIGRELDVQYILQGSIRWEKQLGSSRVRVSPVLIRVSDGAQLWADQYDTTLTGVFAVQATLATRVAGALDMAVVDAERRLLDARPTANLQAYDLYLRGRELVDREFDVPNVQTAVGLYERATGLDSSFALAYTWLSVAYVWLHDAYVDRTPQQLTRAKATLDRALQLEPDLPETRAALGFYDYRVRGDKERAVQEFIRARRASPSNPYLASVLAEIYDTQGRWSEASPYFREAALIDPRNVLVALATGSHYMELRQFDAASYYYGRAVALRPQSPDAHIGNALAYLGQTGDLSSAQRLLPDFSQPIDPAAAGVPIVSFGDVVSLFDARQRARLLTLAPAAMEGDSAVLALAKALALRGSNRGSEASKQFDSARVVLEAKVRQDPGDEYRHALLGLALAGLGRSQDAVREGERAVQLVPSSKDAPWSALMSANLARIYVLVGEREKAIDQLEAVVSKPGALSAGWLRADPFWDPLRASPKFQRLASLSN